MDLFVNILGYTLSPQKDFNLIAEQKTENSAKKSDAAILKNGKVIAIIELKSMKTILLEDIQKQAFEYKNSHTNCQYVITSNFKKLRFYLDNNVEYEDFDLFDLSFERFSVLYSVLNYKSILNNKPIQLKKESTEREEKLTLEFYNDYQGFKEALFLNIRENNKTTDELLIFEQTQKLLDRIIFMSFAKDKGLLPANYIKLIIEEWDFYKQVGEKKTLYDVFKKHFEFLDNGFSSEKYDIYAFNGGLFAFDEVLDNFKISDNILKNQSLYISRYDFESDIDVNVLGHIFEYSLAELDKKKAELSQKAKDLAAGKKTKEQPKRKEDGIFYTPIYITNYIIEETLGKMCEECKTKLNFENITLDKINEYRNWLLSVTVLDPACGSGAFLNQVLTFFIKEHQKLDELMSNLSGKK
ncbi:MAG: restriction endonuclease subunit M, partial [Bacteroidetes bacterium]